jgi:hypothetical protein
LNAQSTTKLWNAIHMNNTKETLFFSFEFIYISTFLEAREVASRWIFFLLFSHVICLFKKLSLSLSFDFLLFCLFLLLPLTLQKKFMINIEQKEKTINWIENQYYINKSNRNKNQKKNYPCHVALTKSVFFFHNFFSKR